jgi:hypothetical protein
MSSGSSHTPEWLKKMLSQSETERLIWSIELSLRCMQEELDAASVETVEGYLAGEFTSVERMHAILIPIRRAFCELLGAHSKMKYLAEDMNVELHKGPELALKLLGPSADGYLALKKEIPDAEPE